MDERPLLEHLIATGPMVIFRRTAEDVVTYVSPNIERILGYSPKEVVGVSGFWVAHVHPDDRDRVAAEAREAYARKATELEREYRFRHKEGNYRWLHALLHLEYDEGGVPATLLGYMLDVTERRALEDALRESERRTRLIIDGAYEAFISIDIDGRVIEWNAQAERAFGWSREEALGRVLADTIVPERYRDAHNRGLENYRATGEGPLLGRLIEIEALRRDGSEFPVELTITRMSLGDTVVFNAVLRDVTERKRVQQALQAAKTEAEQASRAKSDFLARMSHELRTPLNAILGFAQILEIGDLGPEDTDSVRQIVRAGKHLYQLIEELLDVARIEQGQLALSIEPVHLDEIVREALELVAPLAESKTIRLRSDQRFNYYALADRQRLKQVLLNLLANAVKYNREGGEVVVSCEPAPGRRLRIAVADTGLGIAPEMMDRLFLPFERLGAERSSVEGTGIGLSISKRLVELMGGEIGADSEMGRGSRFWVELGSAETSEVRAETAAELATVVPVAPAGERIVLYVEDNLPNLRLVERIFERRPSIRLVAAMQGGLALDLAREHRPDLILLDVHLPDIDGDEVLRRLLANPETRDIPVVVVSAEATPAKIERFLGAGARDYLTKPLDVKKFLEVVDEILVETI
ncbi:MAG: PAS domain S-box protein [Actinobacteria bacterium]|nr:PAS domain S-box protein [Actinomycetota bacterium]